ncbi:MAG: crossover junction endodeoxyribonuclease RuvC [Acidobacteria bacterium]|nr:crossover junction endodeoxyribonuclease RuvC [Acidobacteriota bacterium]
MFVLGIDPGLSTTGYGLVEVVRGVMAVVVAGVIRTDPAMRIENRLCELESDLTELIGEHQIDEAALETVFVNRNRTTAMGVLRASGVALMVLGHHGIQVTEYTPTQVKASLSGYGGADKLQMQRMVQIRLKLSTLPTPADTADALAIAMCHAQSLRMNRAVEHAP